MQLLVVSRRSESCREWREMGPWLTGVPQ